MTIDERLQFLLQSTESLHANVQELHATVAEQSRQMEAQNTRQQAQEAREAALRHAMLKGIQAFLEGLNEGKA